MVMLYSYILRYLCIFVYIFILAKLSDLSDEFENCSMCDTNLFILKDC